MPRTKSNECYRCGGEIEKKRQKQGYCLKCHAAYMRETRPKYHELPLEKRKKMNARSYLNTYIKRGKVKKEACEKCGSMFVEAHHEDYSKPLQVRWLCRRCHLEEHGNTIKRRFTVRKSRIMSS